MTNDAPAQGRIVLVVTSPRVAPGLLTWDAWERLRGAAAVLAADPDDAWLGVLGSAGVPVRDVGDEPVAVRAGLLVEALGPDGTTGADDDAGHREVVWLGSPDGDPGLTDALAEHLVRRAVAGAPPEVELITGSFDVAGSRLLDLVAVMDRLRSPGGCPWDAQQTHESLLPYLLEESHEVIEAVQTGDRAHLQEELGDLLLQVVFHARMAQDDATAPFGIDEVAAGIVEKLVRRHPHVFADVDVSGADEVAANWEDIKAAEKRREGVFDGIPASLPSLARAQKMVGRLVRAAGSDTDAGSGTGADAGAAVEKVREQLDAAVAGDEVAAALVDVVLMAAERDVDAESALRAALSRLASGTM